MAKQLHHQRLLHLTHSTRMSSSCRMYSTSSKPPYDGDAISISSSDSSDSSSSSDSSDSDDDDEVQIPHDKDDKLPPKPVVEPAKRESGKAKLELAKPGKLKQQFREARLKQKELSDNLRKDNELDIEPGMTTAMNEVAEAIGDENIKSDLLLKLQEHNKLSMEQKEAQGTDMKDMFSGLKTKSSSKTGQGMRARGITEEYLDEGGQSRQSKKEEDFMQASVNKLKKRRAQRQDVDIKLFQGPALDIFRPSKAVTKTPSLFDTIERQEFEKSVTMPPDNAFEEQIRWKKQGITWDFPVNNEHGLDHEQDVGFHEHVFLEHLLEEGFPKRGPVRHFMELVCVGLSKNPYLTVQQKHDHIDWYRGYFESKKKLLDELIVSSPAELEAGKPEAKSV